MDVLLLSFNPKQAESVSLLVGWMTVCRRVLAVRKRGIGVAFSLLPLDSLVKQAFKPGLVFT